MTAAMDAPLNTPVDSPGEAPPRFADDAPDWRIDGRDWPNRGLSRFVTAGHLRWHVQVGGPGAPGGPPGGTGDTAAPDVISPPVCLLLHGTGAATHSWRGLLPLLAAGMVVVAPDLPGHGFTTTPPSSRMTLPGMAAAVSALLDRLDLRPDVVIGHSAGAAILARLCLDGRIAPRSLIALNGAFVPFREAQNPLFSGMARLLVLNPLVPRLFAWTAGGPSGVERLIRDTGSVPDRVGVALYARLLRRPAHVRGALSMMANWDLVPLLRDLPGLRPRLVLVTAGNDRAVQPEQARRVAALVPGSVLLPQPGLGHLSHEERPGETLDLIRPYV
ncbi:MAG: magnesium-chelatase 30 kDa subunit [Pseudomonadota bacterium]|jgi:magnesium chelatase accessory protein